MSEGIDWLHFAREDLRVADWAFSAEIFNQACFHSQQCVEKSLKAWLRHQSLIPPRSHQLSLLLSFFPDDALAGLRARIILLDRFYIPTRYPDAFPGGLPQGLPDANDSAEALDVARQVLAYVEQQLEVERHSDDTTEEE